jgi:hypothetical protein
MLPKERRHLMTEAVHQFSTWIEARDEEVRSEARSRHAAVVAGEVAAGLAAMVLGVAAAAPASVAGGPLLVAAAILGGAVLAEGARWLPRWAGAVLALFGAAGALVAAFLPGGPVWPLLLAAAAVVPLVQNWQRHFTDAGPEGLMYGAFAGGLMLALAFPFLVEPVAPHQLLVQVWPFAAAGAVVAALVQVCCVLAAVVRALPPALPREEAPVGWALTRYLPVALTVPAAAWGLTAALG